MGGKKGGIFSQNRKMIHTQLQMPACLAYTVVWMHSELPFLERVRMLLAKALNTHGNQSLNDCGCPRDILLAQT